MIGSTRGSRNAHLAAIVKNSFDAIISKNLAGTIQSWNSAAERIFGWRAEEIVGRSIRTIIPATLNDEEDRILAHIRAGQIVPRFATRRLHKEGKLVAIDVTISPIRDDAGNVVGASKIASDITAAAEFRTRLDEDDRQFRMLADNIPQLAWMADPEGWIYWYNDRWYEYTGTTLEQMQGWGWTSVHHPDHVERVKARIQESWDSGAEWEDTFPLRGRDGNYRWFLSRAKPLLDSDGRIWRWFGTNTDITIQRENEERIRLLMGEVNHRAKNMIAVVQALVTRSADKQFSDTLANRLQALSRNQDVLTKRNWTGAPIGELISSQLAVVGDLVGARVTLTGDLDVSLSPAASETIGLAIHELSTNAMKYGSLSNGAGKVSISVSVSGEPGAQKIVIQWEESGGPAISAPTRSGFGSVMIDRNPRLSLGADVEVGYPPHGFFWRLTAPLDKIRPTRREQ